MPHIKSKILSRSIDDDQKAVVEQWANTFKHNPKDDVAINMAKLAFAMVAAGDFKTRSSMAQTLDLIRPSKGLTTTDYLSHASRIIIDYVGLSPAHQTELSTYFPAPTLENKVVCRAATHAVVRSGPHTAKEFKGVNLGVISQLPTFIKTPCDFGINIAMGGAGQINLYEKTIAANGFSGHLYFHHNKAEQLLMLGLEQSAPIVSLSTAVRSLFTPTGAAADKEQVETDQFGQGHSLLGYSDVYTAAGSLYFSDPIYQAKLLIEKGCAPPDKYDAMHVKLNDDNWLQIKAYIVRLNVNIDDGDMTSLRTQLLETPGTSIDDAQRIQSYIALDFKDYLNSIVQCFIVHFASSAIVRIQAAHDRLLLSINALKEGRLEHYQAFSETINSLLSDDDLPTPYLHAITRINDLFMKQLGIDPELNETHLIVNAQREHDQLQVEINELLGKSLLMRQSYAIESDPHTQQYLSTLDGLIKELQSTRATTTTATAQTVHSQLVTAIEDKKTRRAHATAELARSPYQLSKINLDEIRRVNSGLEHRLQEQTALAERLQLNTDAQQITAREQSARIEMLINRGLKQMELMAPLFINISQLRAYADVMKQKKLSKEHQAASTLATRLHEEIETFLHADKIDGKAAIKSFKDKCICHLKQAEPDLKSYGGWKILLANTLLAILLLVVGYAIAILINKSQTGRYAFFRKPDSAMTVESLVTNIDALNEDTSLPSSRPISVSA